MGGSGGLERVQSLKGKKMVIPECQERMWAIVVHRSRDG